MKNLKKNLKWIIAIIGVIIATAGISAYATSQYLASQVDYNKNGQEKVSDALDDLYTKLNTYKNLNQTTTATASDIISGKTAYSSSGTLITGEYNPIITTKGTEWNSGTKITTADSVNSIEIGFVPNTIVIFNIKGTENGKMMYDTNWGNNVSVLCSSGGISTYKFGNTYQSNNTFIISVGSTVTFHTENANTWRWIAIK